MTLVESKHDFEMTEKSMENDDDIKDAIFNNVPITFIEAFVLKNPGDFSMSKSLDGAYYLSIVPGNNKMKKETSRAIHLRIDHSENEYAIQGMLFARSQTLEQLVYHLKNDFTDILGGVLDENISMNRLLGLSSTNVHNICKTGKRIKDKKIQSQDFFHLVYTGEMKFADGKIKKALFEELHNPTISDLKVFYENLVEGKALAARNLPIRLPIGAILNPPTLIYEHQENQVGCSLKDFLKNFDTHLDLAQRIKLCSAAVRILSELHRFDIYHGASKVDNFYVLGYKNEKTMNYELVFNGASGLLYEGKSDNTVTMVDYDSNAPEVAFTRKLSKESGVFTLGRLFEQILESEILKSYSEPPQEEPRVLNDMRRLIGRATRANPSQRPTMNGIVMLIRELLMALPKSTSPINVVHYDQFQRK
ncbi:Protein kinase domain-containing protein [Caenorhabditis elegans]|uniref:Protein kinase domain-containing protein n=1 Tax=Caenorhabditis elegans TaxID=6239 RepID=O01765_CAEEL|nr:Protein kinase domain-containing protein [Caenorhabditis elegans]CCD70768.1 Protein kinase domain-containing protein [Caenorhabditis elegans]|eukprot:NP_491852.1 sperm COMPetition [Caenorhabditis elegans]